MEDYQEKFIREIEVRGLAPSTKRAYLRSIAEFTEFYAKPFKELELDDIKKYLHYFKNRKALGRKTKMSPNTINHKTSTLTFFYQNVLNKNYYSEIPRIRSPRKAPIVLSQDEVNKMINGLHNVFWKAVVMTLYTTGLRQSELRNLKISDIDSKRMVFYIRNAKGDKDRQAILYPKVLECLRKY